jgi:hypothetical protein
MKVDGLEGLERKRQFHYLFSTPRKSAHPRKYLQHLEPTKSTSFRTAEKKDDQVDPPICVYSQLIYGLLTLLLCAYRPVIIWETFRKNSNEAS